MDTPEARKIGMGDVSDERMTESAAMMRSRRRLICRARLRSKTCSAVHSCRRRPTGWCRSSRT